MPLPLILGGAAAIAGAVGIGSAVHGGVKMKEANDTMKWAESKHRESITGFETQNKKTTADMDRLGKKELEILDSFQKFSNIFEQIHNRPEFKPYEKENVSIPAYNAEELKQVSVGAGVLLGGLGGAAVGTAGGFAAAGATTAAVMALGTASTGTAIASLSGVAGCSWRRCDCRRWRWYSARHDHSRCRNTRRWHLSRRCHLQCDRKQAL